MINLFSLFCGYPANGTVLRVGAKMGFTVPAEPLILPHDPVNADFLLTSLFSLDILVRMCACFALKKLTKFWAYWRQKNLLLGHKKSNFPNKISPDFPFRYNAYAFCIKG